MLEKHVKRDEQWCILYVHHRLHNYWHLTVQSHATPWNKKAASIKPELDIFHTKYLHVSTDQPVKFVLSAAFCACWNTCNTGLPIHPVLFLLRCHLEMMYCQPHQKVVDGRQRITSHRWQLNCFYLAVSWYFAAVTQHHPAYAANHGSLETNWSEESGCVLNHILSWEKLQISGCLSESL